MLNFLIGCVVFAVIIWIGFFILRLIMVAILVVFSLLFSLIGWIYEALK